MNRDELDELISRKLNSNSAIDERDFSRLRSALIDALWPVLTQERDAPCYHCEFPEGHGGIYDAE